MLKNLRSHQQIVVLSKVLISNLKDPEETSLSVILAKALLCKLLTVIETNPTKSNSDQKLFVSKYPQLFEVLDNLC